MKQYCRYCAFCFQADEDEFRCSDHPKGEEPHWTRKQINRENHCPNFALSGLGDAETEKPYRPRMEKMPEEIVLKENQVSFL
jgi:hypothetical protein